VDFTFEGVSVPTVVEIEARRHANAIIDSMATLNKPQTFWVASVPARPNRLDRHDKKAM
jgi:hypothetical protein